MARKLVMLTYNVRPGVPREEYEEFTRTVDYPIFRQNPHIMEYSNYIVAGQGRGEGEWFQHFDLMFVDDLEGFDAGGKLHFGDAVILEHAQKWRDRWGKDPETGWRSDVNITYANEIWG